MNRRLASFLVCLSLTGLACSSTPGEPNPPGKPAPTSGSGEGTADGGGSATPEAPTFAEVYALFQARCTGCHTKSAGPAGVLELGTADDAYAALVGKPAILKACAGKGTVVVPGKPAESLLVKKLAGTQDCGKRMPSGLDAKPFTEAEVKTVSDWVAAGAER